MQLDDIKTRAMGPLFRYQTARMPPMTMSETR